MRSSQYSMDSQTHLRPGPVPMVLQAHDVGLPGMVLGGRGALGVCGNGTAGVVPGIDGTGPGRGQRTHVGPAITLQPLAFTYLTVVPLV